MKQKSFTLIEVVVALSILAVGVLGLLGTHRILLQHYQNSWHQQMALDLAEEQLNEALHLPERALLTGQKKISQTDYHWITQKRVLQKGLNEWMVRVAWQDKSIELLTWHRE